MSDKLLVRADLDQGQIAAGGQFMVACEKHPNAPSRPMYADGHLRLLCLACGFESARIKVADE